MIVVANAQNNSSYGRASSSNYSTKYTVALLAATCPDADAPALKKAILDGANQNYAKNYTVNGFLDVEKSLELIYESSYGANLKPEILTTVLSDGIITISYDATISARGTRPLTWSIVSGDLPKGLKFSSDGTFSGIPSQFGEFSVSVKAANNLGEDVKTISFKISNGKPKILTEEMPEGSITELYRKSLSANGLGPITWSLYSGSLPPYLTLNSDGTITGAPSKPGTWKFAVKAQNSIGSDIKKDITLKIVGVAPIIGRSYKPICITLGKPYSLQLDAMGTKPIAWNLYDGYKLPTGLTLDTSTGLISGTPTQAGYYFCYITATNEYGGGYSSFTFYVNDPATSSDIKILTEEIPYIGAGYYMKKLEASGTAPITWSLAAGDSWYTYDTKTFTITIGDSAVKPTIKTISLPEGTVGITYDAVISATGAYNISWSYTGSLPTGLSKRYGNWIKGTPTKAGEYTFTVTAGNSAGSDSKSFTIVIHDAEKTEIITKNFSNAYVGKPYSITLDAKGAKPIIWSLYDGQLAPGLTLSSDGKISGTPMKIGLFKFSVKAWNFINDSRTQELELNVVEDILSQPLAMHLDYFSYAEFKNGKTIHTGARLGNINPYLYITSESSATASIGYSAPRSEYITVIENGIAYKRPLNDSVSSVADAEHISNAFNVDSGLGSYFYRGDKYHKVEADTAKTFVRCVLPCRS